MAGLVGTLRSACRPWLAIVLLTLSACATTNLPVERSGSGDGTRASAEPCAMAEEVVAEPIGGLETYRGFVPATIASRQSLFGRVSLSPPAELPSQEHFEALVDLISADPPSDGTVEPRVVWGSVLDGATTVDVGIIRFDCASLVPAGPAGVEQAAVQQTLFRGFGPGLEVRLSVTGPSASPVE